jgi:sarcosine oxidase subunit alpha
MRRLQPPKDPVTMTFDGRPLVAERGEPVAVSLLAAGHLVLARSPKFHRPRGPACLRAACDGCLARVDGSPNVMTCRVPAAEGTRVETQNVLRVPAPLGRAGHVAGTRELDLLRVADWFFPEGMNHHELLAGVPGAARVLQAFARRVAGLGKLPEPGRNPGSPLVAARAARRDADAIVVGSGPSGMATAMALAESGRRVEVLEEDLEWGGSLLALPGGHVSGSDGAWSTPVDHGAWRPLAESFRRAVAQGKLALRTRTVAAGLYGDDLLVAGGAGLDGTSLEVISCRTLVLATGAHDGVLAFEGNDVPGVLSARAAGRIASLGVSVGESVVVVVAQAQGAGPFGEAFARGRRGTTTVVQGTPVRVRGSSRVREVLVRTGDGDRQLGCDAVVIDAPRAPAYELCAQAGAELAHGPAGFVVVTREGRIRPGVFAVGEVAGTALEPARIAREAAAVAQSA